jgi:integrase
MSSKTDKSKSPALFGKNIQRRRETDDWFYRFEVNGVPYGDTCNTKNKTRAEKFAAALKEEKKFEARKDRDAGVGPMTFGAACDVWWEDEGCNNTETGLKFRLDWLRGQIGANKYLKDITPDDITRTKNARAKCLRTAGKGAKGEQLTRPVSPATVKATLVTLRTVINYAGQAKGAAVRMFKWTTWIKKDEEEFDVTYMTETQQELIWPELSEEVREVAEFNLGMPKRINEILPLVQTKVDIKSNSFPHIAIRIKGKRKEIKDPLGPEDVERLRRILVRGDHPSAVFTYVSERTREYNGVKHVKGQRRPMTYEHFYKVWTAACKKVGLPEINPHCLRHTGATRAYWKTGDIYYVSKLLNHANVETTTKYYVRNDPMVVADMKRRLSAGEFKKVAAKVAAILDAA